MVITMMMTMMILNNDNEEDTLSVVLVGMVSSGDINLLMFAAAKTSLTICDEILQPNSYL